MAEMLGELSELDASEEGAATQSDAAVESSSTEQGSHTHIASATDSTSSSSSFSSSSSSSFVSKGDTRDFANKQFKKARHLLSLGMIVDPQHGPLYHAYGNMELRHGNTTGARDVFMLGIARNCSDVTSIYHAWGMLEAGEKEEEQKLLISSCRGIELGLRGNREVDNGVGFLLHSPGHPGGRQPPRGGG